MTDDVDWDSLRSEAQEDQTNAGLAHIAASVARFRDDLMDRGFRRKEAFKMSRDFLLELMAKTGEEE
jgi:hypothetical protein